MEIEIKVFVPPKPPIITGTVYKTGKFMFNVMERYLCINSDQGCLFRYKKKEDYPMKPNEIIPLKDISYVRLINKSWIMESGYFYFEVFTIHNSNKSLFFPLDKY